MGGTTRVSNVVTGAVRKSPCSCILPSLGIGLRPLLVFPHDMDLRQAGQIICCRQLLAPDRSRTPWLVQSHGPWPVGSPRKSVRRVGSAPAQSQGRPPHLTRRRNQKADFNTVTFAAGNRDRVIDNMRMPCPRMRVGCAMVFIWRRSGCLFLAKNEASAALADHDGRRVGVARDERRHDRRINHAQAVETAHLQIFTHDRHAVVGCSHLRRPCRVEDTVLDTERT